MIRLSVPRELVEALGGSQGDGQRPEEVPAVDGSRVYDASAWTFINPLPTSTLIQSYLFQADNTAAFDFVLGAAAAPGSGGGAGGSGPGTAGSRLPATGGLPLVALAVPIVVLGVFPEQFVRIADLASAGLIDSTAYVRSVFPAGVN